MDVSVCKRKAVMRWRNLRSIGPTTPLVLHSDVLGTGARDTSWGAVGRSVGGRCWEEGVRVIGGHVG